MKNKSTTTTGDREEGPIHGHSHSSSGDDIKAIHGADHQDRISLDPSGFYVEGQANEEDRNTKDLDHHHTFYYIHCCSCKNNDKDDLSFNNNVSVGHINEHAEEEQDNDKYFTGSVPIPDEESTVNTNITYSKLINS